MIESCLPLVQEHQQHGARNVQTDAHGVDDLLTAALELLVLGHVRAQGEVLLFLELVLGGLEIGV